MGGVRRPAAALRRPAAGRLAAVGAAAVPAVVVQVPVGKYSFECPHTPNTNSANSYFGKGCKADNKYKSAADEEKAIRDMTDPLRPAPEPDVVGNMETDPMMVAP